MIGPLTAMQRSGQDVVTFGIELSTNTFSLDEENQGFRIAFHERNARGPVHGRRIAWTGYARAGGAAVEQAVANAHRLVREDGVFALVNFGGPEAMTLAGFAARERVPLLFPHTVLFTSVGQRYVFTSLPHCAVEVPTTLRLAAGRGLNRIALVRDVNAYGQTYQDLIARHAPESGCSLAGVAQVADRAPADLSAELASLVSAGADAVFMALYPGQARTLMAAKARLGWTGTMIASGPLTDEQYLLAPDGAAEGTLGFCHYPDPDRSDEPGMAAYRAAIDRFHPGHACNRYSLYGYVFGKLIVEGLERAGPALTRETFIDAMETISDWPSGGIMPAVSFSAGQHHAQHAGFPCELRQARFEPVEG